jgi:hypothetical protein
MSSIFVIRAKILIFKRFDRGANVLRIEKVAVVSVLAILVLAPVLNGQQSKIPMPAPVPVQISAAQKVFISNAGGESFETVMDQTVFNGGPDRPYNELDAAMKAWGRYELVSSPGPADLILEVSWTLSDTGLRLPVLGQLRVVAFDPKTRAVLWTFIEYVRGAVLLGNRDKNFDQALNTIVGRLKTLAGTAAAPDSAQK